MFVLNLVFFESVDGIEERFTFPSSETRSHPSKSLHKDEDKDSVDDKDKQNSDGNNLKTIQQPRLTVSSLQDRRAALASSLRVRIPPANVQQALPNATGSAHQDSEFAGSPTSTGNADGSLSTSIGAMSSSMSPPSSNEDETDADGESLTFHHQFRITLTILQLMSRLRPLHRTPLHPLDGTSNRSVKH
jgi:hypothetical protein